jgi:hypothetical protein
VIKDVVCNTRGHWCHIIVFNVHATTENKTDDVKDSIWELECIFSKVYKYHMTILLNFNPEVRRKRFSNQQLGM